MRQRPTRPRLLQAMLDAFSLPDLRRRILITLGILIVFRFIAHVPLPGVDTEALRELLKDQDPRFIYRRDGVHGDINYDNVGVSLSSKDHRKIYFGREKWRIKILREKD